MISVLFHPALKRNRCVGHILNGEEWKAAAVVMQGANIFQKHTAVSASGFVCGGVHYLKPNCFTTFINKPGNFLGLDKTCDPLLEPFLS